MSDDKEKKNEKAKKDEKNVKDEKKENVSGDGQKKDDLAEIGSMTSYKSHHSKATQTKSYGGPPGPSVSRSSPSFVNRTLTIIQDEPTQQKEEVAEPSNKNALRKKGSQISRSTQTIEGPSDLPPLPIHTVHQVTCARSTHGAQPCTGSSQQAGLQRGCCVDNIRQMADGAIMGCCANTHLPLDKQPTAYLCRKMTGFPDSVYPASSNAFCCHGTWKEVPATEGSGSAGRTDGAGTRSFVGQCCTQASAPLNDNDEASTEVTTSVVDLDTPPENDESSVG